MGQPSTIAAVHSKSAPAPLARDTSLWFTNNPTRRTGPSKDPPGAAASTNSEPPSPGVGETCKLVWPCRPTDHFQLAETGALGGVRAKPTNPDCGAGKATLRASSASGCAGGGGDKGLDEGGFTERFGGGLGAEAISDGPGGATALGSMARAVMRANADMTSLQVLPGTLRVDTSDPGPRISRRPSTDDFVWVIVATKSRVRSVPPPSRKRPVRWRSARRKAVASGQPLGAENWTRTCSGSASARNGNPVAVRTRSAIAPRRHQARMGNVSHLPSCASMLGSSSSGLSTRELAAILCGHAIKRPPPGHE